MDYRKCKIVLINYVYFVAVCHMTTDTDETSVYLQNADALYQNRYFPFFEI